MAERHTTLRKLFHVVMQTCQMGCRANGWNSAVQALKLPALQTLAIWQNNSTEKLCDDERKDDRYHGTNGLGEFHCRKVSLSLLYIFIVLLQLTKAKIVATLRGNRLVEV